MPAGAAAAGAAADAAEARESRDKHQLQYLPQPSYAVCERPMTLLGATSTSSNSSSNAAADRKDNKGNDVPAQIPADNHRKTKTNNHRPVYTKQSSSNSSGKGCRSNGRTPEKTQHIVSVSSSSSKDSSGSSSRNGSSSSSS
ncbi:uncharacterized protein EMH_0009690 [Eimeria mitis]|uniref:Uncharacterized protein n=1 Tax=Eimeria mitis TaxID=44415 RepID=U6JTQ1_9EIME|nr:uncharacterized protein EMH_0009690 [Eimeria mitis]CDJ27432.1 hypothetical protein EMH_0009690 [Eimeria mitis]